MLAPPRAALARAAFAVANLYLLFSAIAMLPLATVTAIAFTGAPVRPALPLPVLREAVGRGAGWRRLRGDLPDRFTLLGVPVLFGRDGRAAAG